jgi:hypothetical protein
MNESAPRSRPAISPAKPSSTCASPALARSRTIASQPIGNMRLPPGLVRLAGPMIVSSSSMRISGFPVPAPLRRSDHRGICHCRGPHRARYFDGARAQGLDGLSGAQRTQPARSACGPLIACRSAINAQPLSRGSRIRTKTRHKRRQRKSGSRHQPLRLVAKIAMGYRGYGLPITEVISEGNLHEGCQALSARNGFRLSTYAMSVLSGSMRVILQDSAAT